MATPDERLTTLEKTVAFLQKSSSTSIQELNRNATTLLGIVSSQQLDIKEIKISLLTVEERLDTINQRVESGFETVGKRLDRLEGRFETVEERLDTLEGRFDVQEKKLDQVLQLLISSTNKPEHEAD